MPYKPAGVNENGLFSPRVEKAHDLKYGPSGPSILYPVSSPSGMTWTANPLTDKLFCDQYGIFQTTLDVTQYMAPAGVTYYVDVVNGLNTNDGLTLQTALKAPATAIGKSDIGTMKVVGYGYTNPYVRSSAWAGVAIAKNINVIGIDAQGNRNPANPPYFTTHDVPSWTLTSGMTYTYQTSRSSVSRVVDMIDAANGTDGFEYTQVSTAAMVEATPGSWALISSICYVHPPTNRAADGWIWPLLSVINLRNVGDFTTYLENVCFYGGIECIKVSGATSAGGMLVLNNVEARYSQFGVGNNIAVNGADAISVNSDWSYSGMDGIGYHVLNGKIPKAIEIGCRGFSCGHGGADQATTAHDGTKIIRVMGVYRNAAGAVVADVNDGTESWNLGVIADNGEAGYSFKFGNDAGQVKAWLHGCEATNSKWSIYKYGTAQVLLRGTRYERANTALANY
jgi:hypothetical protein